MCSSDFIIESFMADCGGDEPQVNCSCCTTCCNGGSGECVTNVLQMCENDAEGFEQNVERGTVCECLDSLDEACESDVCSLVSQSCSDSCQSCNSRRCSCGLFLKNDYSIKQL
jgi:hypothetical protein